MALNGNDLKDLDYKNTCAVRVSYALNRSGLTKPYLEGLVSSGADKMWYIYSVKALNAFLSKKENLGPPIPQTQLDPAIPQFGSALTQVESGPVTFTKLYNHYPDPQHYPTFPTVGMTTIWGLVGGKVAENEKGFINSCAIRLSYALNRSGLPIKYSKDVTSSGADKMWYFHTVKALDAYVRHYFGDHPEPVTPKLDWQSDLKGRYGIIEFDVRPGVWSNATGHFSLFNGTTNADGPDHDYWADSTKIHFWPVRLN